MVKNFIVVLVIALCIAAVFVVEVFRNIHLLENEVVAVVSDELNVSATDITIRDTDSFGGSVQSVISTRSTSSLYLVSVNAQRVLWIFPLGNTRNTLDANIIPYKSFH